MRRLWISFTVIIFATVVGAQVNKPRDEYLRHAELNHLGASALVLANAERPLRQAVMAVREEYGWIVDFEDPPYQSQYDLVEVTDPKWRSQHLSSRGAWIVSGGKFQTEYPEFPNTSTSSSREESVLNKIVADYNQSGNPGKFRVQKESGGRYAVIGAAIKDQSGDDRYISSILDTPISFPEESRGAVDTVNLILAEVSRKTLTELLLTSDFGTSPLQRFRVDLGAQNELARDLIVKTLSGTNQSLVFDLFYLIRPEGDNQYIMRIFPATVGIYNRSGQRVLVPIDRQALIQ
jgi:hypothetical protein